jgi:putative tryptophan/tyrosine transport system substrate-binding protein
MLVTHADARRAAHIARGKGGTIERFVHRSDAGTGSTLTRRRVLTLAAGLCAGASLAQGPALRKVGMLFFGSEAPAGYASEPIVRELAKLGWEERRTVEYHVRYAGGRREPYPQLAAELSALPLDAIFSAGSDIARAFLPIASAVPVVFAVSDDPVASGTVQSLARPGGRFTGVTFMSPELAGKRLELLKAVVTDLRRVAVLTDAGHDALYVPEFAQASRSMQVEPLPIRFESAADFPGAFAEARRLRAEAMFVVPSRYTLVYAQQLAKLSLEHGLPAISAYDTFVRAGGLMSYGPTMAEVLQRAASLVDRVLKGARPATLPVEQPVHHELIVNGRTAAAFRMTLPQTVLVRATVI